MPLPYKTRKRLAYAILLIGLPLYVLAAVAVVGLFERPPIWLELLIYVGLGAAWVLPFKSIFLGIGRGDPDAPPED